MDAKKTLKTIEFSDEPKSLESKTISEISVNIQWPSPRDQFIEDYSYCALCGDELIYTHNTHFVNLQVEEEAHCPSCNIRTKTAQHKLQ
jgi:DNA-directed RNA polymerase subunit RPC12/RpoP